MPASTSTSAETAFPDSSWSTPARASSGAAPQRQRHGIVGDPVRPGGHVVVHRLHECLGRVRASQSRNKLREAPGAVHLAGPARLDEAVRVREDEIASPQEQLALGVAVALEHPEWQAVAVERTDGPGPYVQGWQVARVAITKRVARQDPEESGHESVAREPPEQHGVGLFEHLRG